MKSLQSRGMSAESLFAVQAALRRHYERERHSQLGITLRTLTRSDAARLNFWDGSLTIDNYMVQRRYVDGEIERCVIEAAQADATLAPCIGYTLEGGHRPEASAWLLDHDGNVIDPARRLREVQGYLGVALRSTEAANWTPSQPHAVGERSIGLQPA